MYVVYTPDGYGLRLGKTRDRFILLHTYISIIIFCTPQQMIHLLLTPHHQRRLTNKYCTYYYMYTYISCCLHRHTHIHRICGSSGDTLARTGKHCTTKEKKLKYIYIFSSSYSYTQCVDSVPQGMVSVKLLCTDAIEIKRTGY